MHQTIERIKKNIPFNHNLKIYNKEFLEESIKYFSEREEFENCKTLLDFIQRRFDHGCHFYDSKW